MLLENERTWTQIIELLNDNKETELNKLVYHIKVVEISNGDE